MLAGGYDERFQGWGAEDLDFTARLLNLGVQPVLIDNKDFLNTIEHDKYESVKHMAPKYHNYQMTVKQSEKWLNTTQRYGRSSANQGLHWGKSKVFKNFSRQIIEV